MLNSVLSILIPILFLWFIVRPLVNRYEDVRKEESYKYIEMNKYKLDDDETFEQWRNLVKERFLLLLNIFICILISVLIFLLFQLL